MVGYKSVALATLRGDIFNNLSTLIDANKLGGWTVVSSFPEDDPVFPCIVINPAKIITKMLTLDRSKSRRTIPVEIEFFVESKDRLVTLDEGRDNVQDTFMSNYSILRTYGLILDSDNPFIDSVVTTEIFNDQKLHAASSVVQLKLV